MFNDNHARFLTGRSQEFGPDRCFMCGRHIPVGSALRTEEHVFPKWLQREFDLWNGRVQQINAQLLPYSQLTIPCCLPCNGVDLSAIEDRVKAAYLDGLEAFTKLDRRDLFIWLGKIYYGMIYKESLRPMFEREQNGARLVPESHLQTVTFHHFLLQSVCGQVDWQPSYPGPASFHFFECLDHEDPRLRFDYLDDLFTPIIGLRLGKIGVVCILQDWGRSEDTQQLQLNAAKDMSLHPTQFREVYARLNYMTKVSWQNKTHVVIGTNDSATVMAGDLGEFSGTFVDEDYAQILSSVWNVPVAAICKDGHTFSSICDPNGYQYVARSHDVLFKTPAGTTGLWPAHLIDTTTETWEKPNL